MKCLEFKERILEYLKIQKELEEQDIEDHKNLSEEEKEEEGLLIKDCELLSQDEDVLKFKTSINKTKLRPGDYVEIKSEKKRIKAAVLENEQESISLRVQIPFNGLNQSFDIEVKEMVLLDPLIKLIESINEGDPGFGFLSVLAGENKPYKEGIFGGVNTKGFNIPSKMNDAQKETIDEVLKKPQLFCLQGPPGTGKSEVLATIALAFSNAGESVAVVSKTHQAVNNALNKINKHHSSANIVKIGEILKTEDLDDNIICHAKYFDYFKEKKILKRNSIKGDILGMTLQASIINLGIKNKGFIPSVILVDEASQIPLCEAASLGASGAGTIVFIGDDRQMPPIFHEQMVNYDFSISIFEYLGKMYPEFKKVLNITYRMNDEICKYVSNHFYKPYGIKLQSEGKNKNKHLVLDFSECPDERFEMLFGKDSSSIVTLDVSKDHYHEDENFEEALFAAQVAAKAMMKGVKKEDIAIITPFRKQVNAIRNSFNYLRWPSEELPIVDTVERLQGQDVRIIIISFTVNEYNYYNKVKSFLLNANRINVMISRAKEKVVILKSNIIEI